MTMEADKPAQTTIGSFDVELPIRQQVLVLFAAK